MVTKLLILDDQMIYARALVRSLQSQCDVVVATTVQEAKERLSDDPVAALVDIRLREDVPENREGLEFIRWLRENHPKIRVIAMSALDDADLPAQTLAAGAVLFLQKPIRVSELSGVLHSITSS